MNCSAQPTTIVRGVIPAEKPAIDQLIDAANQIEAGITQLHCRLEFVLKPAGPCSPRAANSGSSIRGLAGRFDEASDRLGELCRRIDL